MTKPVAMSFIMGIVLLSTITIVALFRKEILQLFYKKNSDTD